MRWSVGSPGPTDHKLCSATGYILSTRRLWGRIMADGRDTGRPRSPLEMIIAAIAAIAAANDCVVVTANERHFGSEAEWLNPLRGHTGRP
jgi:toxin FitB